MGPNHKLYRELNKPFSSPEELDAAIKAFQRDVEDARKRHRILNIVMMVQCPVMTDADSTKRPCTAIEGTPSMR